MGLLWKKLSAYCEGNLLKMLQIAKIYSVFLQFATFYQKLGKYHSPKTRHNKGQEITFSVPVSS